MNFSKTVFTLFLLVFLQIPRPGRLPLSESELDSISVHVTDLKRAEAVPRKSEQRLSLAIEGSRMATWNIDLLTEKAFGQRNILRYWGISQYLVVWLFSRSVCRLQALV